MFRWCIAFKSHVQRFNILFWPFNIFCPTSPCKGGPKSKSSRNETPLKIKKYKEIHVSGKNLEKKMFLGMSSPTPTVCTVDRSALNTNEMSYSTSHHVDTLNCCESALKQFNTVWLRCILKHWIALSCTMLSALSFDLLNYCRFCSNVKLLQLNVLFL